VFIVYLCGRYRPSLSFPGGCVFMLDNTVGGCVFMLDNTVGGCVFMLDNTVGVCVFIFAL
jgi:hypothetical protein